MSRTGAYARPPRTTFLPDDGTGLRVVAYDHGDHTAVPSDGGVLLAVVVDDVVVVELDGGMLELIVVDDVLYDDGGVLEDMVVE